VAAKAFSVLGDAGINIEMISTSPIKISCVIRESDVVRAVQDLAAAFGLDGREDVHPEEGSVAS
jgi:aspartate kinase